jgi:hypothetical protein
MESAESADYRMWKEETLANQTSHHLDKKNLNEEVMVKGTESNDYALELAQGWR